MKGKIKDSLQNSRVGWKIEGQSGVEVKEEKRNMHYYLQFLHRTWGMGWMECKKLDTRCVL